MESQRVSIKFKVILYDFSNNQPITLGKGGEQGDRCSTKYNLGRISVFFYYFLCQKALLHLGPVHTYPDIFESVTFSFRIRKYPRPHVM